MSWQKCVEVVREMMVDRGYDGWEEDGAEAVFRGSPDVMVFVCQTEKFNIEGVKHAVYEMQQRDLRHAIVVYQNIITSSARKAIEHLQDYTIELFEKKELQYNPTRHRLYCPHIRVAKDSEEVPTKQIHLLPVLLRTDVIARYFHFGRGEVVRVQRKNGSLAYRIVK